MTRKEIRLAKLKEQYDFDVWYIDQRLLRLRIRHASTGFRGHAYNEIRDLEQQRDHLGVLYRKAKAVVSETSKRR